MSHQGGVSQWIAEVSSRLGVLTPAQARVLAYWSYGMGMRQNSERNWVSVRVGMWCCLPDLAYAACSTAHTSPHRSAKSSRWSAKETVSVRC